MSLAAWMPGAVRRPISYRKAAGKFSSTPLGWVLHVVVGNGSPFNTFQNAPLNNRRFSHFWVAKSGLIEQYTETNRKSWAQEAGNPDYFAVETEGFPTEPLTAEQINSLARIHQFLGAANALASHPGQRGIGTHYMGGAAWGGHTCPDSIPGHGPRSRQRASIIAATGSDADMLSIIETSNTTPQAVPAGVWTTLNLSKSGPSATVGPVDIVGGRAYLSVEGLAAGAKLLVRAYLVTSPSKVGEPYIPAGSLGTSVYEGDGTPLTIQHPVIGHAAADHRVRIQVAPTVPITVQGVTTYLPTQKA